MDHTDAELEEMYQREYEDEHGFTEISGA